MDAANQGNGRQRDFFISEVNPEEEKVPVDFQFYLRNQDTLQVNKQGFLRDHDDRGIVIRFDMDQSGISMKNGASIARKFGFNIPTIAKFEYLGPLNMFFVTSLADANPQVAKNVELVQDADENQQVAQEVVDIEDPHQEVIDISSDEEQDEGEQQEKDPYCFEQLVSATLAQSVHGQPMHFPNRVSREILTVPRKWIVLVDMGTLKEYKCRLNTAERNKCEKSLGRGWMKFVRDRRLKEGDRLCFELDRPPTALFVTVVRRHNIA